VRSSAGSGPGPRLGRLRLPALICTALFALTGCGGGGGDGSGTELEPGPAVPGFAFTDRSDVADGRRIDVRFTCDGENVSPALGWEGVPEGTVELALVLEDPDAPGATFTHWIQLGILPGEHSLPEGAGDSILAPLAGENDFGEKGYGGPCPPEGEEHRYVFRLLALHAPSGLKSGVDRAAFDEAVAPHLLAEARLTATYERS
jgi:Raf kinase inhibitor-like YbhB/YbcL family protein